MSLFGSREDDPLLQDDPFAPSDDEPSSSARAPEEAPADDDGIAPASAAPEEEPRPSFDGETARRALVRSVDKAEAGTLGALNTAFDQGWRLDKVVYREETADLLFLLRQQEDSTDRNGLIV